MWIARQIDGELTLFIDKPTKTSFVVSNISGIETEMAYWGTPEGREGILKKDLFPELTWESGPKWKRFVPIDWYEMPF